MAARMPIRGLVLLAVLSSPSFLITTISAAPTCQPPPTIQFKLSNCTLLSPDGSKDVYSWGIQMTVSGSGDMCAAPSTVVNSTVLAATGLCDGPQLVDANKVDMTQSQCLSRRGGLVDVSKVNLASPADTAGLGDLNKGWIELAKNIDGAASATLQLDQDAVTMKEILATKGQLLTQSHLGLAAAAPLLQTLKDSKQIGARSWGLNSGSQSYSSPRSGSLVLGGYDGASRDGGWYDFEVKSQLDGKRYCPLQVEITSMTATISNSTKDLPPRSIVGISDTLNVCIEPYDNLFRIPDERWSRFNELIEDFTGGKSLDPVRIAPTDYQDGLYNLEPGIVYPADFGSFNITLRITIANGLTVEIPSHEFQRPLRGLDKTGKPTVDKTKTELQIYHYSPGEPNDSPVFGKAFLSQLYLYVDYEAMMFHLAKQNLDVSTPLPVSNVTCDDSDNRGLSPTTKGLIGVGAVVGVLLVLLALLWYCFYKKVWRPSREKKHQGAPPVVKASSPETPAETAGNGLGGAGVVPLGVSSPPVHPPVAVSPPQSDKDGEVGPHDPRPPTGHGSPKMAPVTSGPKESAVTDTSRFAEL